MDITRNYAEMKSHRDAKWMMPLEIQNPRQKKDGKENGDTKIMYVFLLKGTKQTSLVKKKQSLCWGKPRPNHGTCHCTIIIDDLRAISCKWYCFCYANGYLMVCPSVH